MLESWERVGLDRRKGLAFVLAVSVLFFMAVLAACSVLHAGAVAWGLAVLCAAGCSYVVSSYPKRNIALAAFRQTLEAPALAASANVYLLSMSRAKALLLLRGEEPLLSRFLQDVRRRTILGYDPRSAIQASGPERHLFSESAKSVVSSVAVNDRTRMEEGSEELDGIISSGTLEDETKLPLFIAVSFFLPIMLMLFAAMAKQTSPVAMVAMMVMEVVILDLVLSVSGSTAFWKRGGTR